MITLIINELNYPINCLNGLKNNITVLPTRDPLQLPENTKVESKEMEKDIPYKE